MRAFYTVFIFIAIGSCSDKKKWINFEYDTVKAYYFEYKLENGEPFMDVAQGQKLNPTIYNPEGAVLNSEQIMELDNLLAGNQNESDEILRNSCYVPHHGFVFYKKDKIIAQVSICIQCNWVKSFPLNKLDQAIRLKPLFRELNIPIDPYSF